MAAIKGKLLEPYIGNRRESNQDISDYTYERTLLMEQRHQMLREMHAALKKRKQARNTRRGGTLLEKAIAFRTKVEFRSQKWQGNGVPELCCNTDNESNRVERVGVHPTCLKNTEKTPTEVDVDKSEANTGYSTTPEHDCLSLAVLSRMDL
ncbi:hypothetical protein OS493_029730 [Desmophyllum pertusum]|uniref:Uncharacterized protein n=1 Tax=Desmophyllum pertusum TaxID=174260 RepID=A0A9W9Z8Y9_9CNID|nr:hypothetical protein OS493_029730 [Desmophyllum pertusum]